MRVQSLFSAFAGGLLLLSAACQAAVEIPFRFRDGLLWVEVAVPNSPEPLHFLLDSGASDSVLDLATAKRLGTRLGTGRPIQGVHSTATAYRISAFKGTLGGVSVPTAILALDLSHVSALCHRKIDGLLGADFFGGRIVQIDYPARKVRLLSRNELTTSGSRVLPLRTKDNALCTRVSVAGEPAAWTRVDTGCKSALEWSGSASRKQGGATTLGVFPKRGRSISADVILGSESFPAVNIGLHKRPIFAGEAGLLGNGLLSRFSTVTFDPGTKRLLLTDR